jgi:ubiquinone/menaquinone biosynthesis C-methylase UbiE
MKADAAKFVRFYDSPLGKQILHREAAYVYHELHGSEAILDVGCGIGSFEQQLPTLPIIGVDVSESMLEEARTRSEKTFIHGDATDLQFPDAAFDAVFTVTTLEFLEDCQQAVREIARVTQPRGKLLVMMVNPHSDYFRENVQRPGDYFQRIQHTPAEIRENVARFYAIRKEEFFLGIQGQRVFETDDETLASLYVLVGSKKL